MYDIVFDLETTGVDLLVDLPVQIAFLIANDKGMVLAKGSDYLKEFSTPTHPIAERVHGITDEVKRTQGKDPKSIAEHFKYMLKQYQPARLIGYNSINFDYPIFTHWMCKYVPGKYKLPVFCQLVDVMHLGGLYLKSGKWLKLKAMAERFGIDTSTINWHDALADVEVTYEIWKKIKSQMTF